MHLSNSWPLESETIFIILQFFTQKMNFSALGALRKIYIFAFLNKCFIKTSGLEQQKKKKEF